MNLLLSLPWWAILLLLLVVFVVVGQVTLFLALKYCVNFKLSERFSIGEAAISGVFALILAFVTIGVWESHSKMEDIVGKEANALLNIYRTLDAYPSTFRDEERENIKIYLRAVVDEEWPRLERNEITSVAISKIVAVLQPIVKYNPTNYRELTAQSENLRLISQFRELHRNRLEGAKSLIGFYVWISLIAISYIFILFLCFMHIQSRHMHKILLFLASSSLAWIFFILVLYDRPFAGPAAISPEPFLLLLNTYFKY